MGIKDIWVKKIGNILFLTTIAFLLYGCAYMPIKAKMADKLEASANIAPQGTIQAGVGNKATNQSAGRDMAVATTTTNDTGLMRYNTEIFCTIILALIGSGKLKDRQIAKGNKDIRRILFAITKTTLAKSDIDISDIQDDYIKKKKKV